MKKLLMGNEAIAYGALHAGVRVAAGYPGTPSTEILETLAKIHDGSVYLEWSVNEKSALEIAAGAAYAGARAMVTMKQVGLNVASDPLMSLNYVGVKGGLVIVAADDPGPISSQTEQDTRHFAQFAKMALFDPSTPEEAYAMTADAFAFSEKYGQPVLLRPATRVCHSRADVELAAPLRVSAPEGFVKDPRWVIFPRLTFANHIRLEQKLVEMSEEFSRYPKNYVTGGGTLGIAAGGVSYAYVNEALQNLGVSCKLLKVSSYPFPRDLALAFLDGLEEALVIEELDPVIEMELLRLMGSAGQSLGRSSGVKIKGKLTGHTANAGENSPESVSAAVASFLKLNAAPSQPERLARPPDVPARPPILCAGCPHRASFLAVKEAADNAVFCGDIGCYTLGNAKPLDMVDTCLCMGAGITVAQGLHRVEPHKTHFAFIGDSTFFHSGIPGIINAVYNQTDIIVAVLDNATTAMTGGQPHPGTGKTLTGSSPPIDIGKILEAIGVTDIVRADPLDHAAAKAAVTKVLPLTGVRAILFASPCAAKIKKPIYAVDAEKCRSCEICVAKLGCPALTMQNGKADIQRALCAGCGLCGQICPFHAIGGAL
ncbi:MAG: indolepyruvate ferredoxin oxidoreductase subunit alpha [Clostridiales bacterium]|jgi:indolepyruvate ferredoxin oxidoreductase alpha subunit|nr:indolepyruvate ferredoxin oxidoreductase subunit alpha [Clostridiales bacterium]